MGWLRDVILILIAAGLLVAVLWPQPSTSPGDSGTESSMKTSPSSSVESVATHSGTDPVAPIVGRPHPLFPLVKGARWVYVVTGRGDRAPSDRWHMEITAAPTPDLPGTVEMGFGDNVREVSLRMQGEDLQISDLPFVAPLQYLDSPPYQNEGKWLPAMKYVIADAVWQSAAKRNIEYRSRGRDREIIVEDAVMIQTDRAQVKQKEKVVVPAGVFEAWLVSWRSRMEIRAGKAGRKVLAEMTTEPFRRETAWFAPGIGMVRRRVIYEGSGGREDIVFSLVSFRYPKAEK
jgi:hypothetical protein